MIISYCSGNTNTTMSLKVSQLNTIQQMCTQTGCSEKLWMPIPESLQGQVGWNFELPSLVEGVPCPWLGP